MHSFRWLKSVCLILALAPVFTLLSRADTSLVYFGTYTDTGSKGIYVSRLDTSTGKLTTPELAAATTDPSYLALTPDHRFLFAANEVPKVAGYVTGFKLDAETGKLDPLNQEPSGGLSPCHLITDPRGKFLITANYSSGNVEVVPIQTNGFLSAPVCVIQHHGSGINKARQEGPHAHCVAMDAQGRVYVCDLGMDKVMIYHLDPNSGQLTTNETPWAEVKPGSGPRHIVFHQDGKFAYVVNEMGGTVTAFAYDASSGKLTEIQTASTLPDDFHGNNTSAEIAIHPSGKFLYASNRGNDSIAVFAIDEATGLLTRVQIQPVAGKVPRGFAIDPTGQFLVEANQNSDNIVVYRINPEDGKLTATGQTFAMGKPVCVMFVPAE
ncbi:MAG TPA: lactonase family protein [Verrucomicrobiae bacterium]|jgi:6-phosphogluconolactonase